MFRRPGAVTKPAGLNPAAEVASGQSKLIPTVVWKAPHGGYAVCQRMPESCPAGREPRYGRSGSVERLPIPRRNRARPSGITLMVSALSQRINRQYYQLIDGGLDRDTALLVIAKRRKMTIRSVAARLAHAQKANRRTSFRYAGYGCLDILTQNQLNG